MNSRRVAKRRSRRGSNGGSNFSEIDRGEASGESVSSVANASLLKASEPLPSKAESFSAGLILIASLPLSDAEKAEAVKRLMAEHAKRGGDV